MRTERTNEPILRYNFGRPESIQPDQMRMLRVVTEAFIREVASALSGLLRTPVSANFRRLAPVSLKEFLAGVPSPACMIAFRTRFRGGAAQIDAHGLAEIGPETAFPMIETLLGAGRSCPVEVHRELTDIEKHILNAVWEQILRSLSRAWQPLVPLETQQEGYETDPVLVSLAPPEEHLIHTAVELRSGNVSGDLNLALSSRVLQLFRLPVPLRSARAADLPDGQKIMEIAGGAKLELEAKLEGSMISFADILGLREGDVLQFDQPGTGPVAILLNGVKKYRGRLGISGGRKAVTIEERIA